MRNRLTFLAVLLALALVAAACGGDDSSDTTSAAADTTTTTAASSDDGATTTTAAAEETTTTAAQVFDDVSLLVVNNMAHLPVFVAQQEGLWAERGLNVDVQILGSGADIAAGLESGQAEFGAVNAGTGVAPQRASGLLTKIVAPYNNDATDARYVKWIGIVGRADAGVTTNPQSLVGKKIGVTGGGTPRAYLTAFNNVNGLSEDDYEIVAMGAPDMLTAIINGDVDAVVPWDPFYTAAIDELGRANAVLVSDGESLVTSSIGLGAVDGQLEQKPDVFKRLIEGLVESTYLIRSDPEANAPTVLNYISTVTEEQAIMAMARNKYDPRVSICLEWGVEDTATQLRDAGRFDATFTAEELIDASILQEVLDENPQWLEDLPPLPTELTDCTGYTGG